KRGLELACFSRYRDDSASRMYESFSRVGTGARYVPASCKIYPKDDEERSMAIGENDVRLTPPHGLDYGSAGLRKRPDFGQYNRMHDSRIRYTLAYHINRYTIGSWNSYPSCCHLYFFPGPIATFLEESVFNHVSGRFYGWLHPEQYAESGYQLIYAMLAIGSGQLFGKGMNTMEVYVPEKHTDMIFTA